MQKEVPEPEFLEDSGRPGEYSGIPPAWFTWAPGAPSPGRLLFAFQPPGVLGGLMPSQVAFGFLPQEAREDPPLLNSLEGWVPWFPFSSPCHVRLPGCSTYCLPRGCGACSSREA